MRRSRSASARSCALSATAATRRSNATSTHSAAPSSATVSAAATTQGSALSTSLLGACFLHGGNAPTHEKAAAMVEARAQMATLGEPLPEDTRPTEMLLWLSRTIGGHVKSMLANPDAADFSTEVGRAKFRLLMEQVDRAARLAKQCSEANAEQVEANREAGASGAHCEHGQGGRQARRAERESGGGTRRSASAPSQPRQAATTATARAPRRRDLAGHSRTTSPPPRSSASPTSPARRPNASAV